MEYDEDITIAAGAERRRSDRLTHAARRHLKVALESDDRSTTRYHLRSALQALVIESEVESD